MENGIQEPCVDNSVVNDIIFVITMFLMPQPARAFECPKHIAQVEAEINDFAKLMENMKGKMPSRDMRFVHRVLDDAKMFLIGAKHSHEEALGYHDHVSAIIRAYQARGHVVAATLVHDTFMKELETK